MSIYYFGTLIAHDGVDEQELKERIDILVDRGLLGAGAEG